MITSNTSASDMAGILASAGLGVVGTDIFVNKEPDKGVTDNTITVYDTAPAYPSEINYEYEYPCVQVRVRSKPHQHTSGSIRVLECVDALHGYVGTIGGIKYHLVRVVNGPFSLGEDERGRPLWTFNCEIQRSV